MSFFDDLIADGIAAAERAWGTTFTLEGQAATFTGTFDRHQDSSAPAEGGYFDNISATIVCNRQQFDVLLGITDEDGVALLTEADAEILIESDVNVFPQIGKRLTHDSKTYLITGRAIDVSSITITPRSVNR